jgi:hypothetical protein
MVTGNTFNAKALVVVSLRIGSNKETGQDPEFDPELNISLVFRLNAPGI